MRKALLAIFFLASAASAQTSRFEVVKVDTVKSKTDSQPVYVNDTLSVLRFRLTNGAGSTLYLKSDVDGFASWQTIFSGMLTAFDTTRVAYQDKSNTFVPTQTFSGNIAFSATGKDVGTSAVPVDSQWVNVVILKAYGAEAAGAVAVVDTVETNASASIGSTNFNNTSTAGYYEVSGYLQVTTLSAASTIILTLAWTDAVGATTYIPINLFSGATTGRTFFSAVPIRTASGSISYSTTVVNTPTYRLSMTVRRIY